MQLNYYRLRHLCTSYSHFDRYSRFVDAEQLKNCYMIDLTDIDEHEGQDADNTAAKCVDEFLSSTVVRLVIGRGSVGGEAGVYDIDVVAHKDGDDVLWAETGDVHAAMDS